MLSILTEIETVKLLHTGVSIARMGDGEYKLCRGAAAKSQEYEPELQRQLLSILYEPQNPSCIVGIPRLNEMAKMTEQKQGFWKKYDGPPYTGFLNKNKIYGSAFITRPDSIPEIDTDDYFKLVSALWLDRAVILIGGDNKPFESDPDILKGAYTVERIAVPSQNAWAEYKAVLSQCLKKPKDTLFIVCAGAMATVLCYQLSTQHGYQALDLGHLGVFYRRHFE